MLHVDTDSFFVIVLIAALAAITVAVVPRGMAPPAVVVELMLGSFEASSQLAVRTAVSKPSPDAT